MCKYFYDLRECCEKYFLPFNIVSPARFSDFFRKLFILTLRKLLLFGLLLYFDSFMYLHTDLVKHRYFLQKHEKYHTFLTKELNFKFKEMS